MLDIKQNIKNLLEPLSIYNFHEGSWDDKEISVYSQFLQDLSNRIDEFFKEIFVQTAENYGLDLKSNLLNLNNLNKLELEASSELQTEEDKQKKLRNIRQKILSIISTNPNHFNKANILSFLSSMGFDCEIKENIVNSEETISISFKDRSLDAKQMNLFKEQVTRILPAHLDVIFDVGKETTWEDFEKISFDQEEDFSWDNF